MRTVLSLAALMALTTACSNVEQVRGSAPHHSAELAGDYRQLAACATRALQANTQPSLVVDDSQRIATILGMWPGAQMATYEVTIAAAGPARSAVAVRAPTSMFGGSGFADEAMLRVQRCSQAAHAPSQR
jgi:hypothetical protein